MPFLDTGRPAPDATSGGSSLNPRVVWLLGQAKSGAERAPASRAASLDDEADAVLAQIERLEVQKARLEGRLVDAYAALHSVEEQQLARLTTSTPVPITADQVAAQEIACATGVGAGEVARRLEFATAPRRHRVLRELLRAGAVSLQRALRVVVETRALGDDVLPDLEATVLAPAPDGSVASARLFATRLQRCVRSADSRAAEERRQSSRLRRTAYGRLVEDGMGTFTVVAPAERVVGVLDRVDALARTARAAGDDRSIDQLRSDLLCDLALFGVVPSGTGVADEGSPGTGLLSDAAPATVRIVVPFEVAVGMSDAACELPGHGWVTAAHARQIMTAPGSVWQRLAVAVDTGRALELSTDCYRPTAAMVEHVRAVDGVCRAPGCQVPADRCDLDHLVPWPTGPTHVSNSDSLSRGCHNGKTAGVWQVERVRDDGIAWSSLAGRDYITYPRDWREALRDPGSGPPGPIVPVPSTSASTVAPPGADPPPF
ncbi:HNH endonuclease signature motif containing protein [Terrabacter sp. Ter38]|uniref:HNH endonuclease signature motif containing protein n=1 Tax=Terrabacter sp. Ter38 TaxID=2926030 RepID=UPI0021183FB3|nr:HNH endonuclease signature motif containing protein [Terrabacter sp. Ter38]